MLRKWVSWFGISLGVLLIGIQIVPYGREHTNPPMRQEPFWDSPRTREITVRACYDCHSNETVWPWYSNIAPASWLIQRDVEKGREELNFSEWDRAEEDGQEAAETIQNGTMPPRYYPRGRLSPGEREVLIRGLEASLRQTDEAGEEDRDEEQDRG